MEFKLQSDKLILTVQSKGAEISGMQFDGIEYIWQAKPEVWPRHAPVLFPIVGKLKNNTFNYIDQSYTLSQHGFARDKEFKMISQTSNEIVFELTNDTETKKLYPFQFQLQIKYRIENNEIFCTYKISNVSDSQELLFSIGAHPGFKVPLLESEKFTDYIIKLDSNKKYYVTQLADGLLTDTRKDLELVNGELKITEKLFDNDALVFEDAQINSIVLKSKISGKGLEMTCKNWPYFGIWSKKGSKEFVCIEPWYGIADSANSEHDFTNKKGVSHLKPLQEFECSFSVRLF